MGLVGGLQGYSSQTGRWFFRALSVTWSQGLLAPNPKVVEPRACYPPHPHACCWPHGRQNAFRAPEEKNCLNSGDQPTSLILIFHPYPGPGPH